MARKAHWAVHDGGLQAASYALRALSVLRDAKALKRGANGGDVVDRGFGGLGPKLMGEHNHEVSRGHGGSGECAVLLHVL